eukprot:757477-Rhodomonas_salina.9
MSWLGWAERVGGCRRTVRAMRARWRVQLSAGQTASMPPGTCPSALSALPKQCAALTLRVLSQSAVRPTDQADMGACGRATRRDRYMSLRLSYAMLSTNVACAMRCSAPTHGLATDIYRRTDLSGLGRH